MKGCMLRSIGSTLVAVALSCGREPTAPASSNPPNPPAVVHVNIHGLWDWTETIGACTNTGTYAFSQTGATFVGSFGQAGNDCSGFSNDFEGAVTDGGVKGNSVSLRARFSGTSCPHT